MSLFGSGRPGEEFVDFREKTFLVIDDIQTVRASLRLTVSSFGGVKIDMAANAFDALRRLETRHYDIILCDYSLGEARDGQQLLEESKRRKLIGHSTIFMMVTAERSYERVVSAVELAPDDYLIKPFTGETLRVRLTRLVKKKAIFAPIYELMDRQAYREAIEKCEELLKLGDQHMIDLIRLKAEIFLALGEYAKAQAMYEQILAIREIPWARMGLAKCQFFLENYLEASASFLHVVEESPNYMEAYDWLAQTYAANGDPVAAQQVLEEATRKSPRVVHRQKLLGQTSYGNGDLETAEASFGAVVAYGKHSAYAMPEDYANLGRVFMDRGDYERAHATMGDAQKYFEESPEAMLQSAVMNSMIYQKEGNVAAAQASFLDAKGRFSGMPESSAAMTLDFARICFEQGDETTGKQVIQNLIKNNHDNKRVLANTERMFEQIGMLEAGQAIIHDSAKEMTALNNQAVRMAQGGDLKGAVDLLMQTVTQYKANSAITLNAAHAILVYMQKEGWNGELSAAAQGYLDAVRKREPDNKKYLALSELYKGVAQKYGIRL